MSEINWKKEICTVPNLLSLFRLLLIPVYIRIYLKADQHGDYILAGSILAVSCLTDLADGMIAREFHMVTRLGKILDPLADKLTQFFLLLTLSSKYPFVAPMLSLFVVKELFQLSAMLFFMQKGKALSGALPAGKICTAALFISLILLVLLPNLNKTIVFSLISVDTALLFYSFYNYLQAYFGRNAKLTGLEGE